MEKTFKLPKSFMDIILDEKYKITHFGQVLPDFPNKEDFDINPDLYDVLISFRKNNFTNSILVALEKKYSSTKLFFQKAEALSGTGIGYNKEEIIYFIERNCEII